MNTPQPWERRFADPPWSNTPRAPETAPVPFDRQLDRLVDGELSPEEYRTFVKSLDETPEGWRRCAVAFLESQAWRQELSPLTRRSSDSAESPPAPTTGWRRHVARWSALAASWFAAAAVGVAVSNFNQESVPDYDLYTSAPRTRQLPPRIAPAPPAPEVSLENLVGTSGLRGRSLPSGGHPPEMEFVVSGQDGDWQSSTRLPLRSYDSPTTPSTAIQQPDPPAVVELLRRTGREVHRQQDLVPLDLPDGRRVVMPVDKWQIKPVRMPAY